MEVYHPDNRKIRKKKVFLLGKSHGQRSLAGSMGLPESDTTERLNTNKQKKRKLLPGKSKVFTGIEKYL